MADGLQIGSGPTEAQCKCLTGRLKGRGRRWKRQAIDAHLAIISNRMNSVMKKMTSWGAIILGSTLVAGIYGMNFRHMPELQWQYGYAVALGIMATITIVGYWYFSRKDWL